MKSFLLFAASFISVVVSGQVPIAIWDFETNTNRNVPELTHELLMGATGSPAISVSALTAAHGTGNGFNYGGSSAGSSAGYFGWTTNSTTNPASDPALSFGAFATTGLASFSVLFDVIGIGSKAPDNIDVYYSTDNVIFQKLPGVYPVTTSGWTSLNIGLPATVNSPANLYIRLIGYNASAGATATDGVLRIDNFTLSAGSVGNNRTLLSAVLHGQALSSGGNFMPTYSNLTLTSAVTGSSSLIFNGTLALGSNNFDLTLGSYTLTFHSANIPITKQNGNARIKMSASSNLVFGINGFTGGSAFVLPNNIFSTGGTAIFQSLTVNRDNSLNLGNQSLTLSGDVTVTKGVVDLNGKTIRTSGNLVGNGAFISSAANSAFIMQGTNKTIGTFTVPNLQLTATGNYTMSGDLTITNTLTLSASVLAVGNNTLSFHTGDIPITATAGKINCTNASSVAFGNAINKAGAAFTIPNNVFTAAPVTIKNFSINRTNALTLNNQNIDLSGILSLTSGNLILPANYLFTLKSTTVANTAMVDKVGGSFTYGTGAAFLVERHIPNNLAASKKAYRDISPSVMSTTTVFQNWQENGVNNNGFGTQITGAAGPAPGGIDPATGFDKTFTGNKSFRTYVIQPSGSPLWIDFASTNQPSDLLIAYKPYRIFIRGNRQFILYNNPNINDMNASVTLRSKGQLITGTVNVTEAGTVVNGAAPDTRIKMNKLANGFTFIANPFAATIDWMKLKANNPSVLNYYLILDPTLGTPAKPGAYVNYSSLLGSNNISSNVNQYIQPGQAFFVKNGPTGPYNFSITEADKVISSAALSNIWKKGLTSDNKKTAQTLSKLNFILTLNEGGVFSVLDGTGYVADDMFTAPINEADVPKATNDNENIAIKKMSSVLNIATGPAIKLTDTIRMRMWKPVMNRTYTLSVNTTQFLQSDLACYLKDRFTNQEHLIAANGITDIPFKVTADTSTYNDRFKLFFRPQAALANNFISATAFRSGKSLTIMWTAEQSSIKKYFITRSSDGKNFTAIDSVTATSLPMESYMRKDEFTGSSKSFYRITALLESGTALQSAVIFVNEQLTANNFSLQPNPVQNKTISLHAMNIIEGNYALKLLTADGKEIAGTSLSCKPQMLFTWKLNTSTPAGNYTLQIRRKDYEQKINCIIE